MSDTRPVGEDSRRDVTINVRATRQARDLIDRAATVLGKTRSDFILETARERAEHVLLDRTVFTLDDEKHVAFTRLLDLPAKPNARLRRLLAEAPPWERTGR
jgi:uncharacterized protein (DUF1778 family)